MCWRAASAAAWRRSPLPSYTASAGTWPASALALRSAASASSWSGSQLLLVAAFGWMRATEANWSMASLVSVARTP